MQVVPYWSKAKHKTELTSQDLSVLAALQYTVAICFTCQLVFALYNIVVFLYRQQRYKALPLSVFYVLTVWLTLVRIYYAIFLLREIFLEESVGYIVPPLVNISIGLIQCWIMYELSLRIEQASNNDQVDYT